MLTLMMEELKKMRVDFTQQMNALQNWIVQIQRNQQQSRFLLRNRYRGPSSNPRPPTSLESIDTQTIWCLLHQKNLHVEP